MIKLEKYVHTVINMDTSTQIVIIRKYLRKLKKMVLINLIFLNHIVLVRKKLRRLEQNVFIVTNKVILNHFVIIRKNLKILYLKSLFIKDLNHLFTLNHNGLKRLRLVEEYVLLTTKLVILNQNVIVRKNRLRI